MSAESLRATPCFNRASHRPSRPIARVLFSRGSPRGRPASTHTLLRSPTFIRIFSAKVPTSAKGIYDVDAFEAALDGRVPENALLSHDLFEGIFARAGLVTDIEFFEEFPSHYEVAVVRQHRWARGDWQLLPWIIGHAPDTSGAPIRAVDSSDRPVEDAR